MRTPSPTTPEFFIEQRIDLPAFSQNNFFPQQKDLSYQHIPHHSEPPPYFTVNASQATYFRPRQLRERHSDPVASNARPKKSYPCPMAKQFDCNDHFTTSGHAARHAKKHIGKKDAFCPECNKAFTRKDNMEQHRRTHQSGHNAVKGGDRDIKKVKQQAKRLKPAPFQSSIPSMSSLSIIDPSLPLNFPLEFMAPAVQPANQFLGFSQRSPYPDPSQPSYHPSSYGGLDMLAIAASGEKRKLES
jgi:hypothetical protein